MNAKLTRILLIEDNMGDVRLIREMLKETGVGQYDINCADRLSTGLEHLAEQRPDIVLLDLGLPDSQGFNTLARVQASVTGIPVIVLTGLDDESLGMEAVRHGAQDYLVKGQIIGKSTALRRVIDYAIERKRMVEELRRTEENFRRSLDDSPLGIRIVDADGKTVYANRVILDLYGYDSLEELNRTPTKERYTPESYAEHQVRKEKRQRGEYGPSDYEISIVRKDGEIRHLDVFRKEVLWNGHTQFQVLYQDITERKQIQDILRASEEKYRMMIETSNDWIWMLDKYGNFTYFNKKAERGSGYNLKEWAGKSFGPIISPTHIERVQNIFSEIMNGKAMTYEVDILKPDGSIVSLSVNTAPVYLESEIIGTVSFGQDITERNKMQQELMAQDRLACIGQLVSGVAHEINNPLTGVIGFSELLLKRELPDDVKADLKIVNDEAMRTAKIVKNLLTFARKQPEGKELVDINEQIQRVLALRDHEQKVNNIQVITRFASDLPKIIGNGSQLQQVFFNIVINAEFFMLEAHQKGNLTITTERIGDFVCCFFADDGPGIRIEDLIKLFTPFFTTKPMGKGTGLGLSIGYGIVTEHGGRIYAESELGKGATFVVELPIKQAETNQELAR